MKISTRVMAILVFALLVGDIGLSIALGAILAYAKRKKAAALGR